MGRLRWLLGALVLLQGGCPALVDGNRIPGQPKPPNCAPWSPSLLPGVSAHSARYVLTAVSEPGQGLPQFITVAYLDDQLLGVYDSERRRIVSHVPWVQKTEQEDPQLWDVHMQRAQSQELSLRGHLATLQNLHNQSGGFHSLQYMIGCVWSKDGWKGGRSQFAYDGGDFIAFDKETLTWTAASTKAQVTKRTWDANLPRSRFWKAYLEETCIEWLQKYLRYGNQTLLRKEPPTVKVTRKDSREGLETLLCRAHGFYPKEIDVVWRKDGEVRQEDTFRGVVSPNVDGTYYTWLSIDIDPKDRSHFRCHVDHDGLLEPLDVALEERTWPALVPVWLIALGVFLVVVLVVLLVAGVIFYIQKRPGKAAYSAASASDQGSDSSSRA